MASRWVVVGAGSAGCVAAARLSEDPDRHVVLVEAGPDLRRDAVPAAVDGADFLATGALPERNDSIVATRVHGGVPTPYRRGRGLGGSSVVNAMVALRGDPDRYRAWGWGDAEAAWSRVQIPVEPAAELELGPVDRALLAADPRAVIAPLTRSGGRRVTSAEAYLWPAAGRSNLDVRSGVAVDRLALDGRRVVGVTTADGEQLDADRVVVAAGAIRTPWLLLRSGLDTPGIGDGLQDHPSAPLPLILRSGRAAAPDSLVIGAIRQHDGIQFLPMNHVGAAAPGIGVLLVALMTPTSRAGTVRVGPGGAPVVDLALLDDPADLDDLARGVEQAIGLLRSPPFTDVVEAVHIDGLGTGLDALDSRQAIRDWLPGIVGDYVHASSSCAMGTVVDADAAVVGYDGVHVCDASVFPAIPDVNTHLPTTMLAERLCARWRASRP
ncbi:MAG TPA: GMC family oxidoreductase [Ilumatobacteraceae bacterium]|nr:GMC family oxidoreductase [Ilumatobacteraceae bacterium]